jgi:hypothetical protein
VVGLVFQWPRRQTGIGTSAAGVRRWVAGWASRGLFFWLIAGWTFLLFCLGFGFCEEGLFRVSDDKIAIIGLC